MDEVKSASREPGLQNVGSFLAVVVTVRVFGEIMGHWHHFRATSRFGAIALLVLLVVEPVIFVRARRRGKPPTPDQLLTFAYAAVLLATTLFASGF